LIYFWSAVNPFRVKIGFLHPERAKTRFLTLRSHLIRERKDAKPNLKPARKPAPETDNIVNTESRNPQTHPRPQPKKQPEKRRLWAP
jgi:hypothetical protein